MGVRRVGKFLLGVAAGLLVVGLCSMVALDVVLDRVPQYPARMKEWFHERTGYHIGFSRVATALTRHGPELYFTGIELRSRDDRRVLARAAGARIGADLWEIVRNAHAAGRLELDSPVLTVERTRGGGFIVASEIDMPAAAPAPGVTLADLPLGDLTIRNGALSLLNGHPALPVLELRGVNVDLTHGGGGVRIRADLRLPPELGGALTLQGRATGIGPPSTLDWTAKAVMPALYFAGWQRLLPDPLAGLPSGTGTLAMDARGHGATLAHADLDFSAADLVVRLEGTATRFDRISGSLSVAHADDRWSLTGRRFRAQRSGGRADPDSDFDAAWRGGDAGLLQFGLRASYLRADTLLPFAGMLPQKSLRDQLRAALPSGEWMNMQVGMARAGVTDPWHIDTLQGRFRGLGLAPLGPWPGVRGLNGSIAGNGTGGRLDLDGAGAVFAWPLQFGQPIDVQRFATTLYWTRTPQAFLVATPSFELRTRDATAHGRLAWTREAGDGSPTLTLAATVDNGNVAAAHSYLPRARLPAPAFNWLNRALVSGHLSHADVVFNGPITHFPFRDGSGLFLVRAALDHAVLDYREGWPRGENLDLQAEFRNEGLNLQLAGGRVAGIPVKGGTARFADFKDAELDVRLNTAGDAADALRFLCATPLDALAENAFSRVRASGPMEAQVSLFFPFKHFDDRRILVHTTFTGAAVSLPGTALAAAELNGEADIDGAQVARADLRGQMFGAGFQMQARSPPNRPVTRTQLDFRGTIAGDALRDALSLPSGAAIGGQTEWRALLKMSPAPARERSLRISSNLVGLDLELPEPLVKPSTQALPTSVEIQWPATGGAQARAAIGSVLRGEVSLDSAAGESQLARAAVTFGSGAQADYSDAQKVNTGGRIERLDLAGWLKLYSPATSGGKPLTSYLSTAKVQVSRLDYLGLSFLDVALDLRVTEGSWRIGVGGPNVVGSIVLPSAPSSPVPWQLEFSRLKFVDGPADPGSGGDVNGALEEKRGDPHSIPAVMFHAAQMTWGEREFGDVRARLEKLDDGIGLKELTITSPQFGVEAKGEWRGRNAGVGRIEGSVSSSDVGATLKQLGYNEVIEAKTGRLDFDLGWVGAPTSDSLSQAVGQADVALDKGQITGLKPGAGRVLGLTSLAALPRRFALDFSDLTDKGFAFDTARGSFELRDGSAYTDDVLIKGPAAEIGLIGRVGLKNQDYDQTAVVTGSVSSALPLAAFVGGPVIGAAVLVFTQVFKQPLKGLARGYYRITGNWDNPMVERIKSADAAAATAEVTK